MAATVQQMLHEWLVALGFAAMARDVLAEQDAQRLRRYARVILRQVPATHKEAVRSRFVMLRLV